MSDPQEEYTQEELAGFDDNEREALGLTEPEEDPEVEENVKDESVQHEPAVHSEDIVTDTTTEEEVTTDHVKEAVAEEAPKQTAQERITEIQEELSALGEKVDDGDIDFAEYNKFNNKLTEEREDIKSDIRDYNRSQQAAQDDSDLRWGQASNDFTSVPGNDIVLSNKIVQDAFLSACSSINESEEAQKNGFLWVMNQAKDKLIESGFTFKSAESDDKTFIRDKNRHTKEVAPVTLGDVTGTSTNETGSEFAHIDNLEGIDQEEALAKLSPDQYDRWVTS